MGEQVRHGHERHGRDPAGRVDDQRGPREPAHLRRPSGTVPFPRPRPRSRRDRRPGVTGPAGTVVGRGPERSQEPPARDPQCRAPTTRGHVPGGRGHQDRAGHPVVAAVEHRRAARAHHQHGQRGHDGQRPGALGRGGGQDGDPPHQVPRPQGGAEHHEEEQGQAEQAEHVAAPGVQHHPGDRRHGGHAADRLGHRDHRRPGHGDTEQVEYAVGERADGHDRGDQHPQRGGHVQGGGPEPGPAVPGAPRDAGDDDGGDQGRLGDDRRPAGRLGPGALVGHQEHDGGGGRQLDGGGHGAQGDPPPQAPAGPEGQTGQHEADHERVVVARRDEAEQGERAEHPQPQGDARIVAEPPGQSRERDHHEGHTHQLERPEDQHLDDQGPSSERRADTAQRDEQRTVRGRRVLPHRGHRRQDVARPERCRRHQVRIGADPGECALGDVAVEVATEQRGAEQERQTPQRQGDPGRPHRESATAGVDADPGPAGQQYGHGGVERQVGADPAAGGHGEPPVVAGRVRDGADDTAGDHHGDRSDRPDGDADGEGRDGALERCRRGDGLHSSPYSRSPGSFPAGCWSTRPAGVPDATRAPRAPRGGT